MLRKPNRDQRREEYFDLPVGWYRRSPSDSTLDWHTLAEALEIPRGEIDAARVRSELNGTSLPIELIASRAVTEEHYCRALAALLGVEFLASVEPSLIVMREATCYAALAQDRDLPPVFYYSHEVPLVLYAPLRQPPDALASVLRARPGLRQRMRIVPPSVLRSAIQERSQEPLMHQAVSGLDEAAPALSARTVMTGRQSFVAGLAVTFIGALGWFNLQLLAGLVHVAASFAFLSCVFLRIAAALSAKPLALARIPSARSSDLPIYTVLVALRNEAEIVPELLVALGRIEWPRAKLEIKLICESDDPATREALAAHDLHPCIEVLTIPAAHPRTKPKALAYALPQCKGEFIVLYDAEDRPHAMQLREAWDRFNRSGSDLACLQAPLVISRSRKLLPRLFAFEYAALFRGLLPMLSARNALIPLGGTSNHFRREALEDAGGWDPYNVTEDADLGLRLVRCGYRVGTITHPTYETAPADYQTWLPQRTRWFKGWMQTWLVHMRAPIMLLRDIGSANFALMQVLFAGMVLSALAHALFVATVLLLGTLLFIQGSLPTYHAAILVLDAFNIMGGYTAFMLLGRRAMSPVERPGFWRIALATPVYWLGLSHAAWRAVWHLIRRPHHWEKTPHPSTRRIIRTASDRMITMSSPPVAATR